MKVSIGGNEALIRPVARLKNRGDCDPPGENRVIRIRKSLRGEERMEVLLHEFVHLAGWHIDEEFVRRFAEDAARELTKLGFEEK